MAKYNCKNCKAEKEITRVNLIYLEDKKEWVVKQGLCLCGEYMESKNEKGFPNLIRTEESLRKK